MLRGVAGLCGVSSKGNTIRGWRVRPAASFSRTVQRCSRTAVVGRKAALCGRMEGRQPSGGLQAGRLPGRLPAAAVLARRLQRQPRTARQQQPAHTLPPLLCCALLCLCRPQHTHTHMCACRCYSTPTQVVGGTGHDESVDWWALGVLVFHLITGVTLGAVVI